MAKKINNINFLLDSTDTALLNQQKLELEKLITKEPKETIFITESIADSFRIVQCASTVISFSRKESQQKSKKFIKKS